MKNILLSGAPGIGKTTIIKKVASKLGSRAGGFYTEEIRENSTPYQNGTGSTRVGFSIVTLDNKYGVLAHIHQNGDFKVGKYTVNITDLESIAVTAMKDAMERKDFVIIDEIGKMELLSSLFQKELICAFDSPRRVIATIQSKQSNFCDSLMKRQDVKLFYVTQANRQNLDEQVISLIT